MVQLRLNNRLGGLSLVLGYCVLVVVLFRNPADGLSTATTTVQGVLFFLVLPALGLGSGVHLYLDWPYRTAAAVFGSSYLGVVGVALVLVAATSAVLTTVLGLLLFGLANLALVAALRSGAAALRPE